eukprot:CAMPEP_0202868324 /NCGR_PEP_ID=MMETSP1391-20130828/10755_1 /ASSEMBLY_ACC=CAM_ASM_000867 /TAXON_ID=1034604 /ORGANISM="Chlamydomonas leiostraca, Strain SAG 11-49" /LENGTH=136 /DNA_ID=CAMNT_0049548473 /DNA_START=318 /DNA_END=728 /DNA_ORIENTATION=-
MNLGPKFPRSYRGVAARSSRRPGGFSGYPPPPPPPEPQWLHIVTTAAQTAAVFSVFGYATYPIARHFSEEERRRTESAEAPLVTAPVVGDRQRPHSHLEGDLRDIDSDLKQLRKEQQQMTRMLMKLCQHVGIELSD